MDIIASSELLFFFFNKLMNMNLYVRYFDHEAVATNMDEVVAFLNTINDIKVDDSVVSKVMSFVEQDGVYPFRMKVSYSNYVLFLKTDAKDLAEFKLMEQQRREQRADGKMLMSERKRTQLEILNEPHVGWYDASIMFKRVVQNPETGKCKYVDTHFRARLIAESAMHCYERIIDHLQNRQDVDHRSQFPSAKSSNFEYVFLDAEKDEETAPEQATPVDVAEEQVQKAVEATQGSLDFSDGASEFAS